ncbi:uncharacterized protein LOC131162650, partial [Malania oleifera]|uniref:uncharacterized protein LOC131162650 n=1 Tax=Malania oleifera TaxID=397392 RepID=UPI0025ADFD08
PSSTRPPVFSGVNYTFWKQRMRIYLQNTDWKVWRIVSKGNYVPMRIEGAARVPKTEDEYDDDDMKAVSLNATAMNILYCSLDVNEFNRIMACSTAKEIWDKLEVTYEGTRDVKDSRIDMLTSEYEAFRMNVGESIQSMYTRFTHIINSLHALGKTYPTYEMISKILRGLPPVWEAKATAIAEGRDLKAMSLDELIGSLITYELSVCLKSSPSKDRWYLDSGCSRHMTGDKGKFTSIVPKDGGYVTFGDNAKGRIVGVGKVGKDSSPTIDNVLLVDGLKHNLLSISQLCDIGYKVSFENDKCIVENKTDHKVLFTAERHENVYTTSLDNLASQQVTCFSAINEASWLWHRRLGHASMDLLSKLVRKELVKGLPKMSFVKDKICDAFQMGKQTKSSFKKKKFISTTRPLELLHLDLFGPNCVQSLGGKSYAFVIVDDFSRFTWVLFLAHKNESCEHFTKLCRRIQNEKGYKITHIRSDRGTEFKNESIEKYCDLEGISHNFSAPRTPQQNGVVERKNRSLQEMGRTMLNEHNLPKYFWAEAINTACYVMNRVLIRPSINKTPYELWNNHKPNISYFHVFGCKCFVLRDNEHLGKFDSKSDEGIFLGYALNSKAYRVFNKRTLAVIESIHVVFDDNENGNQELPKDWKYIRSHPIDQIIGEPSRARLEAIRMLLAFAAFKNFKLFQMDVKSAFLNGYINEEVYVEQPPGFENHKYPDHVYRLSKALYGLKQAPRAWYERLSGFLLENEFTRGKIDTTLFIKSKNDDMLLVQIYVDDIIFGATNDELCNEFAKCMQSEFEMSMMGELSFFLGLQIKQANHGTFICQSKYIRDLLKKFNMEDCKILGTPMNSSIKLDKDEQGIPVDVKLYRGMIGSLLYLTASRPDIMFSVCMCARFQANPKESHLKAVKRILRYLVGTIELGLWYPKHTTFEIVSYTDADFAGSKVDRKSTSGTCHYLGQSLVSWFSKKQNSVALSTAEAEYIAARSCAQTLYMKQQLVDFGLHYETIPIKCDNTSAINISKNPISHSRTKHIEIRHHFLRDHVQKGDVALEFVCTNEQWVDIFTKPLPEDRFIQIRRELGLMHNREAS